MADPDRNIVIEQDRTRKALREMVRADVEQARNDLHPKTLTARWANRQKAKIKAAGDAIGERAKKNAPLIGLGTAAILLFAARRPISKLLQRLTHGRAGNEEEER
jgi:hypothetical protein